MGEDIIQHCPQISGDSLDTLPAGYTKPTSLVIGISIILHQFSAFLNGLDLIVIRIGRGLNAVDQSKYKIFISYIYNLRYVSLFLLILQAKSEFNCEWSHSNHHGREQVYKYVGLLLPLPWWRISVQVQVIRWKPRTAWWQARPLPGW